MKNEMRKVYYCDFCKKHSLRSLVKHEKHCTANPHRECRLCGRTDIYKIIPKYKIEIDKKWFTPEGSVLGETMVNIEVLSDKKLTELKDEVNECPACILTVLRCNQWPWPVYAKFDYKKALEEWWEDKNAENQEYY